MIRSIRFNRSRVYSIQSGINLQYIPTPSPLRSKCIITTHKKKIYINQVRNWEKNMTVYDPTPGSENMLYISFEIISSYFCSDCIYFIYIDSKIQEKTVNDIFVPSIASVDLSIYYIYIRIWGNLRSTADDIFCTDNILILFIIHLAHKKFM